ncbi:phage head spike fiber domain-containing protein [Micromonospora chersina]
MTMPTLIVEIGFTAALTGTALHLDDEARGILNTATLAADNLFTDVTQYVTSVTTRRGATRADGPVQRSEAGTATIAFRNDDRRFDPTNLSGPYVAGGVTQVEPLRAVRIRATWNGETYAVWRGFTDQWSVAYDGPNSSTAAVTCFDAFGIFQANNRTAVAAVGAGEYAGERVDRILDGIAWPAGDRIIATGEEKVQATTLDGNVLSELQLTADTELGEFWIDAEGRAVFRARSAAYSETRSKFPHALFGDQVTSGATTINLVANPSVETNITGWEAGGGTGTPTLAQSSAQAKYGSKSLLVTWATGGVLPHARYTITGLTVGRTYTASVWAYVPAGNPRLITIVSNTNQFGSETTQYDTWQRITWTGVAASDTWSFQVWPMGTTTAGQVCYLDGLQVEEGDTATDYVDGDQTGCEWDGVVHTSTSRRLPELPYADADIAYDALSITNQISVTRAGGAEQTALNAGSVSAYLTRSVDRSDLLMQSDAEALMWAEQIIARTALPELRFASVALKPTRDADRLWPQAFGREIGDRIRVTKRPPGGGDPITREAWVRGVEHHLPVDQDWKTTFVLEQARDTVQVTDGFTTASANGWGPADGGETWTTSGGAASEYAKSGGTGNHTHPSANVLHSSFITVTGGVNVSVSVDVTVPVVPTGAPITLWLTGRGVDANNYYIGRLSISTAGAPTLALLKRTSGTLSATLASTTPPGTHTAGTTWRIQLDVLGTTVRARTWRPATDSQPDWQVTTTDTSLTGGTQVGVQSRRETGNTNTSPVIAFDTFSASSRVTWD